MPADTQLSISAQALLGPASGSYRSILTYTEPLTNVASKGGVSMVSIANGAVNTAVNLATLFPDVALAKVITLKDVSSTPGQVSFSSQNTGPKFVLAAGGFLLLRTNMAPPILYFDNASGGAVDVEIGCIT